MTPTSQVLEPCRRDGDNKFIGPEPKVCKRNDPLLETQIRPFGQGPTRNYQTVELMGLRTVSQALRYEVRCYFSHSFYKMSLRFRVGQMITQCILGFRGDVDVP